MQIAYSKNYIIAIYLLVLKLNVLNVTKLSCTIKSAIDQYWQPYKLSFNHQNNDNNKKD